jgi:hypothetical protein
MKVMGLIWKVYQMPLNYHGQTFLEVCKKQEGAKRDLFDFFKICANWID